MSGRGSILMEVEHSNVLKHYQIVSSLRFAQTLQVPWLAKLNVPERDVWAIGASSFGPLGLPLSFGARAFVHLTEVREILVL